MGLFDTISINDPRVVCAAGHRLTCLQTKDLECELAHYRVHLDRIYGGERFRGRSAEECATEGTTLIITNTQQLPALPMTAQIRAYEFCAGCLPVLAIRDRSRLSWDLVDETAPWCEYRLTFVDGRLTEVEPVEVQSRDDVRKRLSEQGLLLLADTDALAVRHFEKRQGKRRS